MRARRVADAQALAEVDAATAELDELYELRYLLVARGYLAMRADNGTDCTVWRDPRPVDRTACGDDNLTQRFLRGLRNGGQLWYPTVEHLEDIRKLDLRAIDRVASFTRLHYTYSVSAAAEGAAAGLAVSGGQALVAFGTVAGAGAPAAPGLGAITAAMSADAAALLIVCSRVIALDALYYGYDPP